MRQGSCINVTSISTKPETNKNKLEMIQAEILQIVQHFDAFCKKNDIQYIIGGGTLLGAVRHNGFIPWDDDFDVYMTREHAEKLIKLWNVDQYNIISFKDKSYYKQHTPIKIHNPNYRLKEVGDEKYGLPELTNYGIFIDIFIIDFYSNSLFDKIISKYFGRILMAKSLSKYKISSSSIELKVAYYIPNFVLNLCKKFFSKRFKDQQRDYVSFGWDIPFYDFFIPKNDFYPLKYYDFHNLSLPGPKDAKIYLKQRYGDYEILPPSNDRRSHVVDIYHKIQFEK